MLLVNMSIQRLEMEFAIMDLPGFGELMHAVKHHPHLRYLSLAQSKITYEANNETFAMLEGIILDSCRRLTHLYLSDKMQKYQVEEMKRKVS